MDHAVGEANIVPVHAVTVGLGSGGCATPTGEGTHVRKIFECGCDYLST